MRAWIFVALVALVPVTALGQETAPDLEDVEARGNFEAGRAAFTDARYADALTYFERARVLSGRAELLYNIGLCHDRLGHDVEALASFEAYLAELPEAANRAEVEQRIATARERIARASAAAEPEPEPEPAPMAPPPSGPDPVPGWALFGTGLAVLAGGAVLVGVGQADLASLDASMGTIAWSSARDRAATDDVLTGLGAGALGIGAVVAGVGLGLALGASGSSSTEVSFGPGSVAVRGTF